MININGKCWWYELGIMCLLIFFICRFYFKILRELIDRDSEFWFNINIEKLFLMVEVIDIEIEYK